ncbi:MAG TPA: lanthionine synthetase LanC family protein [Acidobacteriota bacterium]|nr:lanthionine synthetase LanC family protein [Acidobacteriota bacterium]
MNTTQHYLKFAVSKAHEILKSGTPTTMGLRFPADSKTGFEGRYEHKLYDGASGIGIVLLDLYSATRDKRFSKTVEEISYGLVASTPEYAPILPGLYNGFAGVALFHLTCARILKKQKFLNYAIDVAKLLSQSPFVDTDIFRGAAGTGWLFVALFHATGDSSFLEQAKTAASFLHETKKDFGGIYAWPVRDPRQPLPANEDAYGELATQTHTGLAHGAAGICLFLLELLHLTGDSTVSKLLDGAFAWLDSRSLRERNGTIWPRSDEHRVIQDHWCHGSAGIAQAYLSKYRLFKDPSSLAVAESAAQATWNSLLDDHDEPFCHCHGLSGAIEIFLDVANETGSDIWKKRALSIAKRMMSPAAIRRDAMRPEGGGPSLGLGTAGIVRQMLRLAGQPVSSILTMNREPLSLKTTSKPIRSKNDRRKFFRNNDSSLNELLPPAAIALKDGKHYLQIGKMKPNDTRSILNLISQRPAGVSYFHALEKAQKACQEWSKHYQKYFSKGTLRPSIMGRVLREIAGIVLNPDGDPVKVKRAAKTMITGSIASLDLMFQRLNVDIQGILAKEIEGRLEKVEVLGSDAHFGGQRVVALQFENGKRFLYKGRSVVLDREFAGVSHANESQTLAERCRHWLHPAIPNAHLPTHRIIVANSEYGYAEEICSSDVVTFPLEGELNPFPEEGIFPQPKVSRLKEEDEKRYWYSAGLLAGHAFSLGLHDLHSENVISGISQSTPLVSMHAVDLEIAFGNVIDLEDTQLIEGPQWGIENRPHSHTPLSLPSLFCGLNAEEWVIETTSNGPQPVAKPWKAVHWIWPHLVQNADGSFGYQKHVCSLLRGFADQWMMLQAHAKDVADHLKEKLTGAPMRVVFNPTRSYVGVLLNRKVGGTPLRGIAVNPSIPFARPFTLSEIEQLDRCDIPYYFRILGEDGSFYWSQPGDLKMMQERSFPDIKFVTPFWSVLENQADPTRLARAVVDIAWQIVPQGPFDFHDPVIGVRVARTADDNRVVIIVVLDQKRLICKVESQGKIEWWLD